MIPQVALAIIAALGAPPAAGTNAGDSPLSRQLTTAALDQEAALKLDSALMLLRAARRADSTDIVAEFYYFDLRRQRYENRATLDEYAASAKHWDPRGPFCWAPWVIGWTNTHFTLDEVVDAQSSAGPTPCTTALLGLGTLGVKPVGAAVRLQNSARAVHAFPGIEPLWIAHALRLEGDGEHLLADKAWVDGDLALRHPLLRLGLVMARIQDRVNRRDTSGAHALLRAVRAAVLRDGRPGMVATYLSGLMPYRELWPDEGGPSSIVNKLLALSKQAGDWVVSAQATTEMGKMLVDGGEPLKAIPLLSRAVVIGDSVQMSDLQLIARTLRGRAYTKAGRLADAERDLHAAIIASETAGRLYYRAEAYHNMAHLYETEGRWPEASRAVDHFVVLSREMLQTSEVTSLMDAAAIRWKAGWHASAEAAYRQMVSAIDRAGAEYYYAGEFYERSGDLARARTYYARAVGQTGSGAIALAGMMRVHAALGHADSAEFWARAHDAKIVNWPPLEVPLLPALLARRGRFAESTRIAHDWAVRQVTAGNIEGAAIATVQVAQLLLDAGHADSALIETQRVDSIGAKLNLTRETIRAKIIRGTALVRLGRTVPGLGALDSALRLARLHPSADILFETHLARGDALAAARRTDAALGEYDLAAAAVEHATVDLSEDLDRAGYRERNLRPFDGALRLLLARNRRAPRTSDVVRWLSRRNSAALALAATPDAGAREPHVAGLTELESRLGAGELLLSYLVLDSTVTAIAIERSSARIERLGINAATLGARVAEIRRPLVTTFSGRLDLARTRYAAGAAAELYQALVAPFARELAGKKRLMIAPDGALHALAFDALVIAPPRREVAHTEDGAERFLIDSFEIEYLPSPAFLRARDERRQAERLDAASLFAVEYGAPGAKGEVHALHDVWTRGRFTSVESVDATETTVKRAMPHYDVLHFAVHATADDHDPLASNLRFVADSLNDGYLHANEIAGTKLSAALVVLSACETNAGPIYIGEGVMGIARAFLASGAHAVVATQWPIGAETAVLMREFYTRLARGEAPATALRAAKLMVRNSPATAHPIYWAGFQLMR